MVKSIQYISLVVLFFTASAFVNNSYEPVELTWQELADVEFKNMYIEEYDVYYDKPNFGPSVRAKEGSDVYITGYIIPVDYASNYYVLSAFPYSACFFCGGAGPESVIDLRIESTDRKFRTDERVTFQGRLTLNETDIFQLNYILESAEVYE